MARKRIHLHFGLHKTGSTSIQAYLRHHAGVLGELGVGVVTDLEPDGDTVQVHHQTNCFRIAHCMLRPELNTIMRLKGHVLRLSQAEGLAVADRMNAVLMRRPEPVLVISSESFSFLRTPGERARIDRLCAGADLVPVGVFRDPADWMRSWRGQVERSDVLQGYVPGSGPDTFDFSDRSWLLDHEAIRRFWGPRTLHLSYEAEVARTGSVLPGVLATLGLGTDALPPWDAPWVNRSPHPS